MIPKQAFLVCKLTNSTPAANRIAFSHNPPGNNNNKKKDPNSTTIEQWQGATTLLATGTSFCHRRFVRQIYL